jgi:fructose transport system ATP-binding protein
MDPKGEGVMTTTPSAEATGQKAGVTPILAARGLVKRYGHVTALAGSDFELMPGEILAVIGDNGAGKSSLIKCLSGAVVPDEGEIFLDGQPIHMRTPIDARGYGIETVYQTLAVSPSLDIADNLYLGREPRTAGIMGKVFRKLDRGKMRAEATRQMTELGIMTIQDISQQVESLSGGQRQGVAVARAAAFGSKVIILDEPTAALGVKESAHVLELILKVRDGGIPVILISHNMPHVFEVADRIHIHRLGQRIAVVTPQSHTMNEVVAIMTGAAEPGAVGADQVLKEARRADVAHAEQALKSTKDE